MRNLIPIDDTADPTDVSAFGLDGLGPIFTGPLTTGPIDMGGTLSPWAPPPVDTTIRIQNIPVRPISISDPGLVGANAPTDWITPAQFPAILPANPVTAPGQRVDLYSINPSNPTHQNLPMATAAPATGLMIVVVIAVLIFLL